MDLTATLPPAALTSHREKTASAFAIDRGAILVPSGLPVPIPGSDQHREFHSHPNHAYLAGRSPMGEVLTFDRAEGWTLFTRIASEEERFWLGDTPAVEELAEATGIDEVRDRVELAGWLEARRDRPIAVAGASDILSRFAEYGLDAPPVPDEDLTRRARDALVDARLKKDDAELTLMRRAAAASIAGHLQLLRTAVPGLTERALAARIEAEFVRAGGIRPAYATIVGGGPNGAVLHSFPGDRELRDGDLVLVDAGAEAGGYMSDVTRVFPAGSSFTAEQRDLYDIVLEAQRRAIEEMRPGREYRELHLDCCVDLARGLVHLGILRGDPEGLVERDAHALFFPHGLGHMIGLATHDVGGYAPGRTPSDRFGLSFLRTDRRLEPGHVVTVEPGIYFIRALLENRDRREEHRDAVDWERVDAMLDFGGIRIEDNVVVTESEPENLTAGMPKSAAEIEALRRQVL